MSQLFEFIQNHPWLSGSIVALAFAAIAIELRHRVAGAVAVGPADAVRLMNGGALVLDVRAADAFATGHIIDARNIPQPELGAQAESLKKKYLEKPIVVCCDSGVTSGGAATLLKSQGFTKVVNLRGGLSAWKQENLPLVTAASANKPGNKPGKQKGQGK